MLSGLHISLPTRRLLSVAVKHLPSSQAEKQPAQHRCVFGLDFAYFSSSPAAFLPLGDFQRHRKYFNAPLTVVLLRSSTIVVVVRNRISIRFNQIQNQIGGNCLAGQAGFHTVFNIE